MHTARLLTVSPSMHCGGCLVLGLSAAGGCLLPVGVPAPGGLLPRGCLLRGGGVVSQHALRTEFLTHPTENITLPQTFFADGKNSRFERIFQLKLTFK